MSRTTMFAAGVVALALAATGCATNPPTTPATTPATAPAASTPSVSAPATPSPKASPSVSTPKPSQTAKSLTLSGTSVGSLAIGTAQLAQARTTLEAALGKPTKTRNDTCEVSGQKWTILEWKGLSIAFLDGLALDGWTYRPSNGNPGTFALADKMPLQATFAELKANDATLTQVDLFSTGAGPWTTEARPKLHYIFLEQDSPSFEVAGGNLRLCE